MEAKHGTLFPQFSDDVGIECLIRVPLDYHGLLSMKGVRRSWRALISNTASHFYTKRRDRGLTRPTCFLIPCVDMAGTGEPFRDSACVPHGSEIVILGGDRHAWSTVEFWVVHPITRKLRKQKPMETAREHFVAAAAGGRLFAVGGIHCEGRRDYVLPLDGVECYDFGDETWSAVSSLPVCGTTTACYVNENQMMFVAGMPGMGEPPKFCYAPQVGAWSRIRRGQGGETLTTPPPPTERWMLSSGQVQFTAQLPEVGDGDGVAVQFPADLQAPGDSVTALMQPMGNNYVNPLEPARIFMQRTFQFTDGRGDVRLSGNITPTNAVLYPSSMLGGVEGSPMACEIVATDALRQSMQFSRNKRHLSCMFAVLFL